MNQSIYSPFNTVLSVLKGLGAFIEPISLPSTRYALSAYYVIASAEASSNLARYDGVRYGMVSLVYNYFGQHLACPALARSLIHWHAHFTGMRSSPREGFVISNTTDVYASTRSQALGDEVKKRILLGTYALTAELVCSP